MWSCWRKKMKFSNQLLHVWGAEMVHPKSEPLRIPPSDFLRLVMSMKHEYCFILEFRLCLHLCVFVFWYWMRLICCVLYEWHLLFLIFFSFNLGGVAFWVFSFFFEKKVTLAWFSADISSLLSLEWSRWRTRVAIKFKCDSGWGQCICFTARRSGSSLPLGSLHVLSRYSRFLSHSKCS